MSPESARDGPQPEPRMKLSPWTTAQHDLERIFNDLLSPAQTPAQEWRPRTDVIESADAFTLSIELPGLRQTDISLSLEQQLLTLSGSTTPKETNSEDKVHRQERPRGTFSRSFKIPANLESKNISATFELGILEIKIPKQAATERRQIPIENIS